MTPIRYQWATTRCKTQHENGAEAGRAAAFVVTWHAAIAAGVALSAVLLICKVRLQRERRHSSSQSSVQFTA